jgi:hypothetical protein
MNISLLQKDAVRRLYPSNINKKFYDYEKKLFATTGRYIFYQSKKQNYQ